MLSYGRDTDDNITQLGSSSTAAAPLSGRRTVRLSSFRACLAMRAVPYRKVHTEYKDGLFLLLPLHRARGIIEGQIHSGWMALKSVPTYFYIRSFTFYGFRLVVSSSTVFRAIL